MSSNDIVLKALALALSDKLLLWASLLSSVGLWVYAAYSPDTLRLVAAAALTLGVYIPMLYASSSKG